MEHETNVICYFDVVCIDKVLFDDNYWCLYR